MLNGLLSLYSPSYPGVLVYMLQSTEYQVWPYVAWFWRTKNFTTVMHRRVLEPTKAARLLLIALRVGISLQILIGLVLVYLGIFHHIVGVFPFGLAVIVAYPVVWAHLLAVPVALGRELITKPNEQKVITASKQIFADHPGIKIAVVGSYGKTTMKELLVTVLSEAKKVAATPANKNVASSHAYFARKLQGDETVLVIEYGEGGPGDVARFATTTQPTHAVITGVAPAHLDHYKTLQAAAKDIFSVADFVPHTQLFVNGDSPDTKAFLQNDFQVFNNLQALGWGAKNVVVRVDGTSFTMHKGKQTLELQSGLIGRHHVGFLLFAAALALQFGLTKKQVEAGIAKTKPFEHRMQPYQLSGAWIIDDSYNGNLEGLRAGTQLLATLQARRKIYVTPGLVDQGKEKERVHVTAGTLIAAAKPDVVVLMKNSATSFIRAGLETAGYSGEVRIEHDPLQFYQNLDQFVAKGDVVLLQNDWTDNYA
jgi:UDP-N-acetylmuramyl pentapeptide synthase